MNWQKELKEVFQLLRAISAFRLFINEISTMNAMYGAFLVYLSLRPSSNEIWAYPGNNATPFWPIGDRIKGVLL